MQIQETHILSLVEDGLQKVSCKDKQKWRERVSLPHPLFAVDSFARDPIKKDFGGTRRKNIVNPGYP
jgi:hypothetical protein